VSKQLIYYRYALHRGQNVIYYSSITRGAYAEKYPMTWTR